MPGSESDPPLCGAKHFAEQNLDAGRIQFARADSKNGGPHGNGVSMGNKRNKNAEKSRRALEMLDTLDTEKVEERTV